MLYHISLRHHSHKNHKSMETLFLASVYFLVAMVIASIIICIIDSIVMSKK